MLIRRLLWIPVALFLTLLSSPAAYADGFATGDFVTYAQGEWPSNATAIQLINANFYTVYGSTGGVMQVGTTGSGTTSLLFDSPSALFDYLPASGPPAALQVQLLDPTSSESGVYGGDVTALKLNVDFSALGLLPGSSTTHFGDLVLMGFTGSVAGLNGMTVSEFLALNETALSGGSTPISITDLDPYLQQVDASFTTGVVTDFAATHLELPATGDGGTGGNPVTTPEPSSLLMLGAGLLALQGLIRRRNSRQVADICPTLADVGLSHPSLDISQ